MKKNTKHSIFSGLTLVALVVSIASCGDSETKKNNTSAAAASLITSVETLQSTISTAGLIVLDARSAADYAAGHISGALNVPTTSLETSVTLPNASVDASVLLDAASIAPKFAALGINTTSKVVVYDSGQSWQAARIFWALEYYGFTAVSVLDGGISKWTALGGVTVTTASAVPASGNFVPVADPARYADFEYVGNALKNSSALVVDALAATSFASSAIVGSKNLPYTTTFDTTSGLLKTKDELRQLFINAGFDFTKQNEFVSYCQRGNTASQNYFVARYLGIAIVRNYDGSLTDWVGRGGATGPSGIAAAASIE